MRDPAALPCKLLLAEDDPLSASYLSEALAMLGYDVVQVSDGVDALRAACTHPFGVLLLDLGLPRIDGDAVLAALRSDAHATSRNAPALALSAETSPALARRLTALGFAALLAKPLSLQTLEQALIDARAGAQAADFHRSQRACAETLAILDDRAALTAIGSPEAIADLRRLLAAELPQQALGVANAIERRDHTAALAVLHRLKSSSQLCGANALAAAVDALVDALRCARDSTGSREHFARMVSAVLVAIERPAS